MANSNKTPAENNKELMAPVAELIAKAKKDGTIQASELSTALEKLDLSPEQIEKIYDSFDAMGIQIAGAELNLDPDSDLDIPMENIEEEELVDPVELAAEYNLDDPVRMYLKEIGRVRLLTARKRWSLPRRSPRVTRRPRTS